MAEHEKKDGGSAGEGDGPAGKPEFDFDQAQSVWDDEHPSSPSALPSRPSDVSRETPRSLRECFEAEFGNNTALSTKQWGAFRQEVEPAVTSILSGFNEVGTTWSKFGNAHPDLSEFRPVVTEDGRIAVWIGVTDPESDKCMLPDTPMSGAGGSSRRVSTAVGDKAGADNGGKEIFELRQGQVEPNAIMIVVLEPQEDGYTPLSIQYRYSKGLLATIANGNREFCSLDSPPSDMPSMLRNFYLASSDTGGVSVLEQRMLIQLEEEAVEAVGGYKNRREASGSQDDSGQNRLAGAFEGTDLTEDQRREMMDRAPLLGDVSPDKAGLSSPRDNAEAESQLDAEAREILGSIKAGGFISVTPVEGPCEYHASDGRISFHVMVPSIGDYLRAGADRREVRNVKRRVVVTISENGELEVDIKKRPSRMRLPS